VALPRRGDDIKVSPAGGATSRYGGSGVRWIQLRLQPSSLLYANELNNEMNQARGAGVQREKGTGCRESAQIQWEPRASGLSETKEEVHIIIKRRVGT